MEQTNKKDFAAPVMLVDPIPEVNKTLSDSADWGVGEFSLRRNWSVGELDIE